MTLGDELRAALNQQADVQNTSRPDVHRLISGGRVRRRRRNVRRAGGAALALVLFGGGAYAVTQDRSESKGSGIANQSTETSQPSRVAGPPTLAEDPGPEYLEPGTYRIVVDSVPAGPDLEAHLVLEGAGWSSGDYPTLEDATSSGGFAVYRPDALAAGTGCVEDEVSPVLGESRPRAVAQRLAELPRSTVVQPITLTQALGRDALHLRLRISPACPGLEYYRVADTPRGSRGVTYPRPDQTWPPVIMDFWVMEVDGIPVVVDSWHQQGVSSDLVDRIAQAREAITFVSAAE